MERKWGQGGPLPQTRAFFQVSNGEGQGIDTYRYQRPLSSDHCDYPLIEPMPLYQSKCSSMGPPLRSQHPAGYSTVSRTMVSIVSQHPRTLKDSGTLFWSCVAQESPQVPILPPSSSLNLTRDTERGYDPVTLECSHVAESPWLSFPDPWP